MKISVVIDRRAADEVDGLNLPEGSKERAVVRMAALITGTLRYLDELHARGILPMPLNPTGPWKGPADVEADPETPELPATAPMEPTRARLYSTIAGCLLRNGVHVTTDVKKALVEELIEKFGLVPPEAG